MNVDLRLLEELRLASSPLPWIAVGGRVWFDDGEDEPDKRSETLVARLGNEDRNRTDTQFMTMCVNSVPELVETIHDLKRQLVRSRSQSARLADAMDEAIDSGAVDPAGEKVLRQAIVQLEKDMAEDGIMVQNGPTIIPAGVQDELSKL